MSDKVYQCPECKLHYDSEALAKKCQAFCERFHACSFEIIRSSVESRQQKVEVGNEG